MTNWQNTVLWATIQSKSSPETTSVQTTLHHCMPNIQKVLAVGGTAPTDFTLHDSGHAFRVAQRMVQIIPENVLPELNGYELTLLLLSAYLHDIGMTPERQKVQLHHHYLLTGNAQDLNAQELEEFQKWLDDEHDGITPPLCTSQPSVKDLRLADELTTFYCRHRHNDWGEQWIRNNIRAIEKNLYVDWLDDLIILCRSHHDGYTELKNEKFTPRIVGANGVVLNLRYLACVLRIADILEFDPERTPEVIIRHRDVSHNSLIYWWKDHQISLTLEGNRLVFFARPPNSQFHRALETTANEIDQELRICRTLADEINFQQCPGLKTLQPHRWDLLPALHRNIVPKDDTYVYIDGGFRPDTKKLLQLLSGVELYGSAMVAVRELLQNAFDAIKEQIAYERLSRPNPEDPLWQKSLNKLHRVTLTLENRADGVWLICKDDGIGMTKAIIRDHVLVSGSAKRHDVLALERRCANAGFSLGRTGQFGIGVLSYFMLGDRVVLKTMRSPKPGDAEGHGWFFETQGIGSFGELRKAPLSESVSGTEVSIHIRPEEVKDNPCEFFKKVRTFILQSIAIVPCNFELNSPISGRERLSFSPGWVKKKLAFTDWVLKGLKPNDRRDRDIPAHLLSLASIARREEEDQYWKGIQQEAKKTLRWKTITGTLSENHGQYRIHIPYFSLPDGASLGFLRVSQKGSTLTVKNLGKGFCYIPRGYISSSWKGMKIGHYMISHSDWGRVGFDLKGMLLEIDWNSSETVALSVNRNDLKISEIGRRVLGELQEITTGIYNNFVQSHAKSKYATLNSCLTKKWIKNKKLFWISLNEKTESTAEWSEIKFPVVSSNIWAYERYPHNPRWKKQKVTIIPSLNNPDENEHWKGLSWNSVDYPPNRIIIYPTYQLKFGALWTGPHHKKKSPELPIHTSQFPRNWENICGVYLNLFGKYGDDSIIWNNHHPLIKAVTNEGWTWCIETLGTSFDPLPYCDALLSQKGRCAAWILFCLRENLKELWDGLKDREPSFLKTLWQKVFSQNSSSVLGLKIILVFPGRINDMRLRIASLNKWEIIEDQKEVAFLLPDPGPEWKLTIPRNVTSNSKMVPQPEIRRRKVPTPKSWWEKDGMRNFMPIKRKEK